MWSANLAVMLALAGAVGLAVPAQGLAAPCDTPEHRQFDFWLGTWDVRGPSGLAGINRIEREYDGCVVHERYDTQQGYRGESLNVYDASRQVWHQTWVDTNGLLLLLEGGLQDGSMVMEGATVNAEGRETRHRITWTPAEDGSVRQHWESKAAAGDWKTVFDGTYTKR